MTARARPEAVAPLRPTISPDAVRAFREGAIDNGYALVRVRSFSKAPLPQNWQHGDEPECLLNVRVEALNTGLLLAGLRCVDVDVDDPQLILKIGEQARLHLPPGALMRQRANSARLAMLYRAAEGRAFQAINRRTAG